MQIQPTEHQVQLVKDLIKIKKEIWKSDSREEIISLGQKAIDLSKVVIPKTFVHFDGREMVNYKGKESCIEIMNYDIADISKGSYSNLEAEQDALILSLHLLIGSFVSSEDSKMIEGLK